MSNRVFTDEELRVAGLRSVDALAEALAADNRIAALGFARRLRREVLSMLRNYEGWESSLLSSISDRGGEVAAQQALAAIEAREDSVETGVQAPERMERWREDCDAICGAIEAGDSNRALARATELHDEALACHDRGMARVTALLSWIGRGHGAAAVQSALETAMSGDMLGDADFRSRAEALMHFTRVHLQPFELREDEEKITFLCPVCPSGGRLLREGHYAPPHSGWIVEGPSPLTYGRSGFPVYCCHEPVMEMASIEATGVPMFVVDPSDRLGVDPCPTYLYKDPAKIPGRFYARLGLSKPDSDPAVRK